MGIVTPVVRGKDERRAANITREIPISYKGSLVSSCNLISADNEHRIIIRVRILVINFRPLACVWPPLSSIIRQTTATTPGVIATRAMRVD